jgi:hypothetical protein
VIRRPLVRRNGRNQQLPAGDMIAGVPVAMPAFQAGGLMLRMALTVNYSLPVLTAAGATLNVPVVINA